MNQEYSSDSGGWRSHSSRSGEKGYPASYDRGHDRPRERFDEERFDPRVESYGGPSHEYDRHRGRSPPSEERESRKRPAEPSFYTNKICRMEAAPTRFTADGSVLLQEETRRCLSELSQELAILEQSRDLKFLPHTRRIVHEEIQNITSNTNVDWLDVESEKYAIRIYKRVLLPPSRPGSNVVGKLMGVGGKTLRHLCQTYKCHISICGAGSRKDYREEEDLLRTGDPKHSHLNCPLHAEVSTTGPPHLAYSRLADILTILHLVCTTEEAFEYKGIRFESHAGPKRREVSERYLYEDEGLEQFHDLQERHNERLDAANDFRTEERNGSNPRQNYQRPTTSRSDRGRGRGGHRGGYVPRGARGYVPR